MGNRTADDTTTKRKGAWTRDGNAEAHEREIEQPKKEKVNYEGRGFCGWGEIFQSKLAEILTEQTLITFIFISNCVHP